jgi:hypothetical protein
MHCVTLMPADACQCDTRQGNPKNLQRRPSIRFPILSYLLLRLTFIAGPCRRLQQWESIYYNNPFKLLLDLFKFMLPSFIFVVWSLFQGNNQQLQPKEQLMRRLFDASSIRIDMSVWKSSASVGKST